MCVCERKRTHRQRKVLGEKRGGGEGVVMGVRFTLVRLAPLDIPDIPTSRMLVAPSSACSLLGAVDSRGLSCL